MLLLSNNLALHRTSTSSSVSHFILNFRNQQSSLSMELNVFQIARWKVYFCNSSSKPFAVVAACFEDTNEVTPSFLPLLLLVLRDKRGVPKTLIALEVIVQGKFITFWVLLVYFEFSRLYRLPCFFLFEFKFAARQVAGFISNSKIIDPAMD